MASNTIIEPKEKDKGSVASAAEPCPICMENYTKSIRKQISCQYCHESVCSKCVEKYMMNSIEDPHCMHCRKAWTRGVLGTMVTKTFLNGEYLKARQNILLNREKSFMPQLQLHAERELRARELERQNELITVEYNKVMAEYNKAIGLIQQKRSDLYRRINRVRSGLDEGGTSHEAEKKKEAERQKFVRRCTADGCKGFLSSVWKCGLCNVWVCPDCFEVKGTNKDDAHTCKKENLETAALIKKDTKPCPTCGEVIMKTDGCFAKDTPILLWNGQTKMSQDICVGDELVGDDGKKRTVLDTFTGEDTLYEVTQNNGMTYIVNSKHTLVLKYSGEGNITWNDTNQSYNVRWFDREKHCHKYKKIIVEKSKSKKDAYKEISEFVTTLNLSNDILIMVDEYMKLSKSIKASLVGFKCEGIHWEKQTVKLDPYLMGVYLGDGVNDGISFAINPADDPEILMYLLEWCEKNCCEVVHDEAYRFRVRRRGNKNNVQKAITKGASCESCKGCSQKKCEMCDLPSSEYTNETIKMMKNPLKEALDYYGLVRSTKKIPLEYIVNDRDTRLQVLAGIIDTDGHLNKMNEGKRIQIISANKEFADQIVFLSQSLGFATRINTRTKKGVTFKKGGEKKDYNDQYLINISGHISEIPTRIARKKCVDSKPNKDMLRTSIKVTEKEKGQYYGWMIDGNHKFMLNDMTSCKNCDQMWCTSCHNAFSWNTGKVVTTGVIHNPHYYQWLQKGGQVPQNPRNIPCGGLPDGYSLRRKLQNVPTADLARFTEIYRICAHVIDVERHRYERHLTPLNNQDIGVKYMLNELTEDDWKKELAKREKDRQKSNEIRDILDAFNGAAIDIFRQIDVYSGNYTQKQQVDLVKNISTELDGLRQFSMDAMCDVSKSFNCSIPMITPDWKVVHGKYTVLKPAKKRVAKKDEKEKEKKEKPANAGAGKEPDSDSDDYDSD